MATFSDFAADLTLDIIKFLNVIDSSRLASVSRRYFYLVHEYRQQRGAELVAMSNANVTSGVVASIGDLVAESVRNLQSKPNMILSFSTEDAAMKARWIRSKLRRTFGSPSSSSPAVLLEAEAYSIQANNAKSIGGSPTKALDDESSLSFMAINFPNSQILPFKITHSMIGLGREVETLLLERQLQDFGGVSTWKAVIVYATDHHMVESFISRIQTLLPTAAIVGGVCNRGYVSKPKFSRELLLTLSIAQLRSLPQSQGFQFVEKGELVDHIRSSMQRQDEDDDIWEIDAGLFGVVLGGDVPVKSVVSRGVQSVFHGKELSFSPFVVEQATVVHPSDDNYWFDFGNLQEATPYHIISKIHDTDTQESMTAMQLIAKGTDNGQRAEFIGLKRIGGDGFELENLHSTVPRTGELIVFASNSQSETSLEGAQIDLFYLDGTSCMEDMDVTVAKLQEQTIGKDILGALMITCAGRGPEAGHLIPERMSDATRFAKGYPKVPCLGFYAGGEIGPRALAGKDYVFQSGQVAVQGFTAVFMLLVVPNVDGVTFQLDDSPQNVRRCFESVFHGL